MQMADDEARGTVLPGWRTRVTRQEEVESCVATAMHNQSSYGNGAKRMKGARKNTEGGQNKDGVISGVVSVSGGASTHTRS